MWVRQLREMFDDFVDEKDLTFLSVANRRTYLERGYLEFRRMVANADPEFYAINVDLLMAGVAEYDLAAAASAVRILGAPAGGLTGPRLRRAIRMGGYDDAGNFLWWVAQTGIIEDVTLPYLLPSTWAQWAPFQWSMQSTRIMFDSKVNGTVRLTYDPYPSIDWTLDTSLDNTFVDDLDEYHDLIPALAYRLYLARDDQQNQGIEQLIARRYTDLQDGLSRSRLVAAGQRVREVY